ncbi:Penicillin-binding protein 2D [bacterium HR41]|nr:Penicillin-binding protein 2D [bacterium HR41]
MTYRRRQRRRRRSRRGLLAAVALLAVVVTASVVAVVGYVLAIAATAPGIDELKPLDKGRTSVVYAADGSRLGFVQSDVIRTPIPWSQMPAHLRNATVAIEDSRFWRHHGVDYTAIIRAGIRNLQSGKTVQGGSTITQQLVRALYIKDPQRNFARKIREAKLASELEKRRSKRWILQTYLNTVPYGTVQGRTALGVEAAAETFFDKHARDLTLTEAALLAGLPQAPSYYNPFRNPRAALERRNEVLERMADLGYITRFEAARAKAAPLGLRRGTSYTVRREPYFFDYVQERLIERYGINVFRRGGLRVYTTIDPALQEAARRAIQGQLGLPGDPAAAVVSIDPATGYIKAMAASSNYRDTTFNLAAQGRRQPGSAFKTFVLAAAVERGIDPDRTVYVSKPLALTVPGYGPWQVKTYDNTYGGAMTLTRATLRSDNTVYAQLILDLGPRAVCEEARKLGITTKLDCYPAEGLGGLRIGVSPLEMANAYATLASGGIRNRPEAILKVVFPNGKVDELGKTERKRVMDAGAAYVVTRILRQNVLSGTGTRANIGCPAAGKTGTTDNYNDAWFVGYTPKLATAVWVGYPNAQIAMRSVHGIAVAGGTFPAAIWHDYMQVARRGDCSDFPAPPTLPRLSPFMSSRAVTGAPDSYRYYGTPQARTGTTTQSGAGSYDPRFYESPPQGAPRTEAPPADYPRVGEPPPSSPPGAQGPSGGSPGGGGAPAGGR